MEASNLGVLFLLLFSVAVFATTPAFPDVCRYQGRQLTIGQTIVNCYANITCLPRGMIEIKDSCPSVVCARQSELLGYKSFDARKPYPDCCSAPICKGNHIITYPGASRTFRPKTFVKRSPHVMGIKFP